MKLRTDLALEEKERFPGDGGEIRGVSLQEWYQQERQIKITEVKILNRQGAKAMGKEMGTYLTIEAHGIEKKGKGLEKRLTDELAVQIRKLSKGIQGREEKKAPEHVLVVGLGNLYVTPDSLGPRVLQHLQVTRHLDGQYGEGFLKEHDLASISGIAPGVMAQTGMETAEILKGVVQETKPELMIAIDALAARSVRRLGCTIQLTDTGIRPGSGVGNHRNGLTRETLGIPVLAIGVPTVVGAAAIVQDTIEAMVKALEMGKTTRGTGQYLSGLDPEEQYALIRELLEPEFGPMFVTPPDIEERVEQLGSVIAEAIELAF
ncbi:MAG: GPR endopeptidase [Lachnospiraceae bacterium]|nr:GPR endopeptidase [Lachnospiraceae bacterium]